MESPQTPYAPHIAPAPLAEGGLLNVSIAALASVCIHTSLLIACALVTWGAAVSDGNGDAGVEVEVAISSLVTEQLERRPEEKLEADEVSETRDDHEALESIELFVERPREAVGETAMDDLLGALAPSGASGGSMRDINAMTGGGRIDGQATFMGAQAQGRRFCIIADRSESMFGSKFAQLKDEIRETLDGMRSQTRVQIIFFNTRALPHPRRRWLHPRDERDSIDVWLKDVFADGDTYPTPAFVQAFAMEPLPDAIFFMTDGQFDTRVVKQILRLNTTAERVVPVHTITFVERGAEMMMRKIAEDSGGTYRHVDRR